MPITPQSAILPLWIVWYSTWILGVVWSRRTKVQMGTDAAGVHRMLAGLGAFMLFAPQVAPGGRWSVVAPYTARIWPDNDALNWLFFALTVAGFAFCWWARIHLGSLWSGFVTLKEDHRIIDTGPYALVRHPIYSGVIFAGAMTALLRASPAAITGCLFLAVGFAMTARIEERFLRAQLAAGAYDGYSRRVGMLIPGLK